MNRNRRVQDDTMRPLLYSINITRDGCCDHEAGIADEELHQHAAQNIASAGALLFGRVIYEMMESAWALFTWLVGLGVLYCQSAATG